MTATPRATEPIDPDTVPTETANALTSRPGDLLETWGQLEALVAGLVPRASTFSDGEADACARIMGGGL